MPAEDLNGPGTQRGSDLDKWEAQLRKGCLELAVLATLAPGRNYGLEIIRHLQEATDLVVGEGTIYPILGRLTRDGLLQAEWQASAAHPRKYYRLTDAGTRRLRVMVQDWRMFASKIDRLVKAAAQEGGK